MSDGGWGQAPWEGGSANRGSSGAPSNSGGDPWGGDGWGTPPGQAPQPQGDVWAQPTTVIDTRPMQRPPLHWLVAGLGVAVVAVGLGIGALLARSPGLGSIGWLLAGPVAFGLLCVFIVTDAGRRQRAWYVPSATAAWLRRALVLASLVAIVLTAWTIADAVARGRWS